MIEDVIKYLKSGDYDINEKGGKIYISDKNTMYLILTIESYRLKEVLKKIRSDIE